MAERDSGVVFERDAFFELSGDLLGVAGLDGFFKRVNPAWTDILGWTTVEICATPWLDFVHPDDRAAAVAAGETLRQGGPVVRFTNRYRHRDGTYRWLEWHSVSSLTHGLIYAIARDVTARRETDEALVELTESLATTLHSIGDGVIATDAAGAVLRMNPVAEQITGWALRDCVGRPLGEVFRIIHAGTRRSAENPVDRVLREGVSSALANDVWLLRPDGTEVPIADSCSPIRDARGTLRGAVLVIRDTSEELRAMAARERVQRRLEVAERMASVGTLAAGIAHEINNPLAYVTANLELVREEIRALSGGSTSGRMKELDDTVRDAQEGAERVRKIVRGLKTFSRTEEECLGVVDIHGVLEVSINMAFNEIRHRARLVKDYGPVPTVIADDARLGQVFINLLVNAAQALPIGEVEHHEIRVVTATDAEGRAVIEVRDTGPGIPSAVIDRIFEPFFTTKPVGVGTGLGLSICHNIITGMGGTIDVTSVVGCGATFRVTLPPTQSASMGDELAGLPSATTPAPVPRRAAVLVVDDEPAVGVMLGRVLRQHEVTTVTRAADAVRLLEEGRRFDVILSDLMMPAISGMDLYDELARRFPEAAERMVFLTGGAFTPAARAFLDRVSNERVDKPFTPDSVRSIVEQFVR
ncbi:MAG: PAS domain S-box protein [Deltaproteobacteria bacterium]|nr:PAS domain S-box protein [Myxococcales bacterium]MDP3217768.1 PAS domain S-box protein [Deltaproteobacteria bacterium]